MRKHKKATAEEFYSTDSPPLTDRELSKMRPHKELFPDWPKRITRGPQKAPTKIPVSIRLSSEVVDYFKAQGKGWQTRVDDVLQEFVNSQ